MGYAVNDSQIGFSIRPQKNPGEKSAVILLGELDALGIDEPIVISPFDQRGRSAIFAVDLKRIAGGFSEDPADLIDVLDPGIGLEGFGGVDQKLLVERRMEADRLGGFDDLAGEKIAHPGGAIDEDNFRRAVGECEAAIDVNLADAKDRDDAGNENDGDCRVQGDAPAEIALERRFPALRGGRLFRSRHGIVIIGRLGAGTLPVFGRGGQGM